MIGALGARKGVTAVTRGLIRMMFAGAALIASAGLCAAQDRSQNEARWALWLLNDIMEHVGPDSDFAVIGGRVIVTSEESFVQDGRNVPIRELICERTSLVVHEPQLATRDLYPVPEGFCETLLQALRRRAGERP
jgi:hypothetical protein